MDHARNKLAARRATQNYHAVLKGVKATDKHLTPRVQQYFLRMHYMMFERQHDSGSCACRQNSRSRSLMFA